MYIHIYIYVEGDREEYNMCIYTCIYVYTYIYNLRRLALSFSRCHVLLLSKNTRLAVEQGHMQRCARVQHDPMLSVQQEHNHTLESASEQRDGQTTKHTDNAETQDKLPWNRSGQRGGLVET